MKKIVIYPLLSSGHTNVCVTIAKLLLNNYPNEVDITFLTDKQWEKKLTSKDERFKFRTIEYENKEDENHVDKFIEALEPLTKLPLVQRIGYLWQGFEKERLASLELDRKYGDLMIELKPDLILMDQMTLLPSVVRAGCPYAFIVSSNPLVLNISPEYPALGSDAGVNELEKIKEFRDAFAPYQETLINNTYDNFVRMNVQIDEETRKLIHKPVCKHFTVYAFPKEIDYYSDEVKRANHLISFDTPLIPERISPKYELPEKFASLPGKIIYVSLGSMFSMYHQHVQRLINILATLDYKYIISKGANGHKITFPDERFIGDNFVDQLGVLQVVDAMIAHGGNNSLGEAFYFGVPCIILPVFVDQINNGKRIEETGYGYQLPINDYTDEQLKDAVAKLMNNEEMRAKWKKASERIQREKNHNEAAKYIFNYV